MQIELRWDAGVGMTMPIAYHHIIQGIIYHNLSLENGSDAYGSFLHNDGYRWGERQFRQFTYGQIKGRYSIENGNITFYDQVSLEIRSPEPLVIQTLADQIDQKGLTVLHHHFPDVEVLVSDYTVENTKLHIGMASPICIYITDPELNKTIYLSPDDEGYQKLLNENFYRKYYSFYHVPPARPVTIRPLKLSERQKYITRYKGIIICAWFGEYEICGERKYLDYLYQAGLGSKNSQGFGMFDIKPSWNPNGGHDQDIKKEMRK